MAQQAIDLRWYGVWLLVLGGLVISAMCWPWPQFSNVNNYQLVAARQQLVRAANASYASNPDDEFMPSPYLALHGQVALNEMPDINQIFKDFPTAAGAIHANALVRLQYQAAMEGHYQQAMRLMGRSFRSSTGSGSYATNW